MMQIPGTICNMCKDPLARRWYRCLRCVYVELCSKCQESKCSLGTHYPNHPVQSVLSSSEQAICYRGELRLSATAASPYRPFPRGYTCPYCAKLGLSIFTLLQHINEHHRDSKVRVNCPVCYAEPGTETLIIENLIEHMNDKHMRVNYATDASSTAPCSTSSSRPS